MKILISSSEDMLTFNQCSTMTVKTLKNMYWSKAVMAEIEEPISSQKVSLAPCESQFSSAIMLSREILLSKEILEPSISLDSSPKRMLNFSSSLESIRPTSSWDIYPTVSIAQTKIPWSGETKEEGNYFLPRLLKSVKDSYIKMEHRMFTTALELSLLKTLLEILLHIHLNIYRL